MKLFIILDKGTRKTRNTESMTCHDLLPHNYLGIYYTICQKQPSYSQTSPCQTYSTMLVLCISSPLAVNYAPRDAFLKCCQHQQVRISV